MARVGRPRTRKVYKKLTRAVMYKICGELKRGGNRIDAAREAGVSISALKSWMENEQWVKDWIYEAEAAAVIAAERVLKASDPAKWLAARRPKLYGKRAELQITGGKEPIKVITGIDPNDLL